MRPTLCGPSRSLGDIANTRNSGDALVLEEGINIQGIKHSFSGCVAASDVSISSWEQFYNRVDWNRAFHNSHNNNHIKNVPWIPAQVQSGEYICDTSGAYACSEYEMLHIDGTGDPLTAKVTCLNDDASCVLNAENSRRVMNIEDSFVNIRALRFKGGSKDKGGGLYVSHSSGKDPIITLDLCVFQSCSASADGGAIYVNTAESVSLSLVGVYFNGNSATTSGKDLVAHCTDPDCTTIAVTSSGCPAPYRARGE